MTRDLTCIARLMTDKKLRKNNIHAYDRGQCLARNI